MLPENKTELLLLGEGNFSFALALAMRLEGQPTWAVSVTATSFDSQEELFGKYPESMSTLRKLRKCKNFSTEHQVDATQLTAKFPEQKFDEVWFNFPHLGKEDIHSHRAFAAHYFSAAISVLSPGGVICIALSKDQHHNWKISESAERLGLESAGSLPLRPEAWPGYHLKRHHTGRSFATRVNDLYHYCFRMIGDDLHRHHPLLELLSKCQPPQSAAERHGKRKRVHTLTDGKYSQTSEGFQCGECGRSFATDQGARTHVYNVHILGTEKLQATSTDPETAVAHVTNEIVQSEVAPHDVIADLTCEHCGKRCADASALQQHVVAKHTGAHTHIMPYWADPSNQPPPIQSQEEDVPNHAHGDHVCPICLWRFPQAEQLAAHLAHGFAPQEEKEDFQCSCGKRFGQQRALLQHRNFCLPDTASCT